jgi:RNA-directed DNA polymerase
LTLYVIIMLIEKMTALNTQHSIIFNTTFSQANIEEMYNNNIALSNSKGIDRLSPFQFDRRKDDHFFLINRKCLNCEYSFSPFLEKLILRGKERPPRVISIATVRDRIVLSLLKEYLHTVFPECVNRKLPNTFIREIKDFYIQNKNRKLNIVKLDIESFYTNIVHNKLLKMLSTRIATKADLLLIRRAIETQTVSSEHKKDEYNKKNQRGVPQGLAISNILANIYLHIFDEKIKGQCIMYLRYVDDIFLVVKESDKEEIQITVNDELKKIGLKTNNKPGKTVCVPLKDSLEYLGYLIKLPNVSVKNATMERYLRSISNILSIYAHLGPKGMYPNVKEALGKKIFVSDLNEKITGAISENKRYGWIFYFLEMTDLPLLYRMDLIIRHKFYTRIKNRRFRPVLKEIKKLSRSYYEAKNNPFGGYIHNYNQYDTLPKKTEYLTLRGMLLEGKTYTQREIERLFTQIKKQHISHLESDVGETS